MFFNKTDILYLLQTVFCDCWCALSLSKLIKATLVNLCELSHYVKPHESHLPFFVVVIVMMWALVSCVSKKITCLIYINFLSFLLLVLCRNTIIH